MKHPAPTEPDRIDLLLQRVLERIQRLRHEFAALGCTNHVRIMPAQRQIHLTITRPVLCGAIISGLGLGLAVAMFGSSLAQSDHRPHLTDLLRAGPARPDVLDVTGR